MAAPVQRLLHRPYTGRPIALSPPLTPWLRLVHRFSTVAVLADGAGELVPAAVLARGDLVVCEAGDVVPSDGEIVEGLASIDESAITGESAPVIRESGGDRSAVTGGTRGGLSTCAGRLRPRRSRPSAAFPAACRDTAAAGVSPRHACSCGMSGRVYGEGPSAWREVIYVSSGRVPRPARLVP